MAFLVVANFVFTDDKISNPKEAQKVKALTGYQVKKSSSPFALLQECIFPPVNLVCIFIRIAVDKVSGKEKNIVICFLL